MPVSYAFIANTGHAGSQLQNRARGILKMTGRPGAGDATRGKLAAMAGSIPVPLPPGEKPKISDPRAAYLVNIYFTADMPEGQKTSCKEGLMIEVPLEQKFYAVMSIVDGRPGHDPSADWPPFAVKAIGAPKDLNKIILNSAAPRPPARVCRSAVSPPPTQSPPPPGRARRGGEGRQSPVAGRRKRNEEDSCSPCPPGAPIAPCAMGPPKMRRRGI